MVATDTISQLPGGAELATLLAEADKIQPDGVRAVAQAWLGAADRLRSIGTTITGAVDALDGTNSGPSHDNFVRYMDTFTAALTAAAVACTAIGHALTHAADAAAEGKSEVDAVGKAVADIIAAARQTVSGDAFTAWAGAEVAVVTAQVRQIVDGAFGTSLRDVATAIDRALGQFSPRFSTMKAPGGGLVPHGDPPTHITSLRHHDTTLEPPQKSANLVTQPQDTTDNHKVTHHPVSHHTIHHTGTGHVTVPDTTSNSTVQVGGDVQDWIKEAMRLLEQAGVSPDLFSADDIALIVQHESSGNPRAVNEWDYNAAAGHPSMGLMQTIQSTFNAYALPGHTNVWNPVDNIIAGVRYAIARYGSVANVPGVLAVHHGSAYVGY